MTVSSTALMDSILSAAERLRPHVRETPLLRSESLSASAHSSVWLKCENLQYTGSFKLRGALNKLLTLAPDVRERGIVTASTGNHARGVAQALTLLGTRGTVYLPTTASAAKVERLKQYSGVTLEFHGTDGGATEVHARAVAERTQRAYVSPYNDWDVVAGQGTIGVELLRACPQLDAVFVSVGGGGLIGGIASFLKAKNPAIRVIGCWPQSAQALYAALQAGRIVEVADQPTLSDATAGGVEPGAITFDLARRLIDECVLVSEAEIAQAIRFVLEEHRLVIEGAAGVAVAAYRQCAARYAEKTVAIVLCGGNISPDTLGTVIRG
jgi:threonine dehydratase